MDKWRRIRGSIYVHIHLADPSIPHYYKISYICSSTDTSLQPFHQVYSRVATHQS